MSAEERVQVVVQGLVRRYSEIIGTAAAFSFAASASTVFRLFSRRLMREPFGSGDYAVTLALLLYLTTEAMVITAADIGRRARGLNDIWDTKHTLFVYVYSIFYFTVIALVIVSILLFYRSVFVRSYVRRATNTLLAITTLWWISSAICEIILPGSAPRTFPGDPQQTQFRVNYITWWFSTGVIEQVIIVTTVLIPGPVILTLKLNGPEKAFLMLTFAMSSLCVATGIARLAILYRPGAVTLDVAIGDVFINLHLGAAIIGANLPLCLPVIRHRKRILSKICRPVHKLRSGLLPSFPRVLSKESQPRQGDLDPESCAPVAEPRKGLQDSVSYERRAEQAPVIPMPAALRTTTVFIIQEDIPSLPIDIDGSDERLIPIRTFEANSIAQS